jgi:hypothetical protein
MALVPTPLSAPAGPPPASVVVKPVAAEIKRTRLLA